MESNVASMWIVGEVHEFERRKCVVIVFVAFGRFRVEWSFGWIVLNIVRIVWNVLESCLNDFGLVFEYASVGAGLIVCSWSECKRNAVELC